MIKLSDVAISFGLCVTPSFKLRTERTHSEIRTSCTKKYFHSVIMFKTMSIASYRDRTVTCISQGCFFREELGGGLGTLILKHKPSYKQTQLTAIKKLFVMRIN